MADPMYMKSYMGFAEVQVATCPIGQHDIIKIDIWVHDHLPVSLQTEYVNCSQTI